MNIEKIARECGCTGLVITWSYPETKPITVPADAEQRQKFTNAILEEAAKVCDDEHVDYDATKEESDRAYNQACEDCAELIRRMKK